jgi:hypothetical protein
MLQKSLGGIMQYPFMIAVGLFGFMGISGQLNIDSFETIGKEKIPLTATLNGTALKRVGTGIRQKRVLINLNVYRASLFLSNPASFVKKLDGVLALSSIRDMDAYALNMQFLRSVEAKVILSSFNEALKLNDAKESPALELFRKAIEGAGNIKEGESVRISVDTKQGLMTYEKGNFVAEIKGDKNFFADIFAIWLGKTNESNLAILRKALIGL